MAASWLCRLYGIRQKQALDQVLRSEFSWTWLVILVWRYPVPAGWHTFPYPFSLEVFAEAIPGHLGKGRRYQKRLSSPVTGGGTWGTMWLLSTRSIAVLWSLGHVLSRASYTFLGLVNVLLPGTATQKCMTSQHPLRSGFTHGNKITEHYYCPMVFLLL